MTLEALLTFIGILLAVLAVARPVQRYSFKLFVPLWWLGAAMLLALVLIICRDAPFGMQPPFGWSLPIVQYGLTLCAFLIPVGAAIWGWASWQRARLTGKNFDRVENLLQAALREREFDEVERILQKNHQNLDRLPASAASVLFNPTMVTALVESHSLIHLELLAEMNFLKSLRNRYGDVDVVTRELLRSDPSPLRSAVVSVYGGLEHLAYADSERALMEKTFQSPDWYVAANAHYPLIISAMEMLRNGKVDEAYNGVGRDYEATQGISGRAHCSIYLAIKTEVLAIEAAIGDRVEGDFYISDLSQIFRAVQERSKFDRGIWENRLSNREHATPYAYLLYEISSDLRELSANALISATTESERWRAEPPGRVAQDLARSWSSCTSSVADSEKQVSSEFRNEIIKQYLLFVLALKSEPAEIYIGPTPTVDGLDPWCDLFLKELRSEFVSCNCRKREAIRDAFESLDQGKYFVSREYEWLGQKLFGNPSGQLS